MASKYALVQYDGFTEELRSGDTLAGVGTVTSVAVAVPSFLAVSGSPVTTSGTITVSLSSQSANLAFLSPNGSSGAPSFRAIDNADLPVVDISHGGHGQATAQAGFDALSPLTTRGDILYHGAVNNLRLGGNTTTTPQFLKSTGSGGVATDPAWAAINAGSDITAGTLPIARGGTNQTSFTNTRVIYFNGTSLTDSADFTYSSAVVNVGASSGGGEIRSHQNNSNFYMSLKTDTTANLSGIYRNNPGFTSGFPFAYSTATGDIICNAFFGASNNVLVQVQGSDVARFNTTGLGVGTSPSAKLHVVSTTEQFRAGSDASNYVKMTVNSSGIVTWDAVGTSAQHIWKDMATFEQDIRCGISSSTGPIVTDSSGGQWRITVSTLGVLTTVSV